MDSEFQLFQKQKKIWSEIDRIEVDESRAVGGLVYGALSEYGTEYLLRWLSNRSNFSSGKWTTVWHYVHEKIPFDDRATQIAVSWMYSLAAEDHDFNQTKSVIFALLQGWRILGKDHPDYGEFLSDRLVTDPALLFNLLRPRALFAELFSYLAAKGDLDDVLKLISFCISELPKEAYILDALFHALDVIIKHDEVREDILGPSISAAREVEQRHIVQAKGLHNRLVDSPAVKSMAVSSAG